MKLRNHSEMSNSAKRTMRDLRQALTNQLKIKPLEKISIQELCNIAMISRGTFYNYFYDKYDLLNYDWAQVQLEIDPIFTDSSLKTKDYQGYMHLFLENLITYLAKERETYQMIIKNNSNSIFTVNMHEYIADQIYLRLNEAIESKDKVKIPLELLATVYAGTIITVGKWWLKSGEDYSKDEVYEFFNIIIDNSIREVQYE